MAVSTPMIAEARNYLGFCKPENNDVVTASNEIKACFDKDANCQIFVGNTEIGKKIYTRFSELNEGFNTLHSTVETLLTNVENFLNKQEELNKDLDIH